MNLAYWKRIGAAVLFIFLGQAARADVSPITLGYFGLYGSPVQPLSLASSTSDAFGWEILMEANLTNYFSLGISYEQTTFFSNPHFFTEMGNVETRLFPFLNEHDKFSPYIYGGAGVNLLSGGGPYQLKAGIGSRISFAGPFFIDVAAGSHWVQDPGSFQYVDLRAGLSFSFDYKEEAGNSSSSTTTTTTVTHTNNVNNVTNTNANNNANANAGNNNAANTATAANAPATNQTVSTAQPTQAPVSPVTQVVQVNVMVMGPTPTATVISLDLGEPTPNPTPVTIFAAPVTTYKDAYRYYTMGMDAFDKDQNYRLALKYLKKSLELREIHKYYKHQYYFAEAYATIGVIYQWHAPKVKDHLQKALSYYRTALKIDPTTKSARHYYYPLKRKLAAAAKSSKASKKKKTRHKPKPKPKPKPTPSDSSAGQDSSGGTGTSTINFN